MNEKKDTSKKVRDKGWESSKEQELVYGREVGLREDPGAAIVSYH